MKYGNLTLGQIEAGINKIGGEEAFLSLLRDELVVPQHTRRWREQNGVIYFTLPPTDGTTGPQWIERLEKKGFQLSKWSRDVLNSPDFKPTTGVVNNIAVLKGELFSDGNRFTKKIRAEGDKRKLKHGKDISPEIACQIREMFTDEEIKEMGLVWIIAMHESISDSDGDLRLLNASRNDDGRWLYAYYGNPDYRWNRENGFAFVVPQASPQN